MTQFGTTRRSVLVAGGAALLSSIARSAFAEPPASIEPFSFERLVQRAADRAAQPYVERKAVPDAVANLSYDEHRRIRYRRDQAIWANTELPYRIEFFHLGFVHREPVLMNVVVDGKAQRIAYDPALFDFDGIFNGAPPAEVGYAGFRVLNPLNDPGTFDELMAFLGASYFRALGRGTRYGISARGLAIDTGLGKREEFPAFTEFWIERPERGAPLILYATLEGPSVVGAYRFTVTPAGATTMDVDCYLFLRRDIEQLGIAPLTSMYDFGTADRGGTDDFRPAVHDSDGLSIWTGGGGVLWRPVANPSKLRMSVFLDKDPRGFGLWQRERNFAAYQDLEARYDLRPTAWVEPRGKWGPGSVRLIEIPSPNETNDNIVAFWTPEGRSSAGSELRYNYRLVWSKEAPVEFGVAKVRSTRVGRPSSSDTTDYPDEARRIVIDFDALEDPAAEPNLLLESTNASVYNQILFRNDVTGGWRVSFVAAPQSTGAELRCALRVGESRATEFWLYRLDAL